MPSLSGRRAAVRLSRSPSVCRWIRGSMRLPSTRARSCLLERVMQGYSVSAWRRELSDHHPAESRARDPGLGPYQLIGQILAEDFDVAPIASGGEAHGGVERGDRGLRHLIGIEFGEKQ